MTDAREIIAKQVRWGEVDRVSAEVADNVITALHAAGIRLAGPDDRILGPDEVDPVTVEKCADIAKEQAEEEDGAEGFLACKTLEDAIRALGRKA